MLPFVELWSFVRRSGARTRAGRPGLIEGNCPNCGAPVERTAWARCGSCQSLLRSGVHDWVLVEISQEGEPAAVPGPDIPGIVELRGRDPGLSLQIVEDRASVLFWRWMASLREGGTAPLRGHASDAALEAIGASVAAAAGRTWPGECGVGSVTVRGFAEEDARDVAVVLVRWSGTLFRRSPAGSLTRVEPTGVRAAQLVLERTRGATSFLDEGFSSAHCQSCGAPESKLGVGACEHCGAPPAGWEQRWRLAEIDVPGSAAAARWTARLSGGAAAVGPRASGAPPGPPPLRREVVQWLVALAAAEDGISARERKAILRIAQKAGIAAVDVERLLSSPVQPPTPADPAEANLWFRRAAEVALVDGSLSAAEKGVLARLARTFSLGDVEVRLAIRDAQSAVLAEASRELREARARGATRT